MSLDIFMDDTCPKCRKPTKLAGIKQHATRRELAVHNFKCTSCGHVTTKNLYQKPNVAAA
jgi:hypothetical protein